jgi:hypothetical protein
MIEQFEDQESCLERSMSFEFLYVSEKIRPSEGETENKGGKLGCQFTSM